MKHMKIILIIAALAAAGAIFIHRQAIMEFCGITETANSVQIQSTVPQPQRTRSQRQEHSPIRQAAYQQAQSKKQNSKKYQQDNSPAT